MLQPDDEALVSRDCAQAAGLRAVLDDDRLLESIRARWPALHAVRVESNYIRYKPATSCIVGFTGRTRLGQTFDGYAKATAGSGDAVALHRFPDDATLPHLRGLATTTGLAEFIKTLLPESWCASNVEPPCVRTLAYKPERRAAIRVSTGESSAVFKYYTRSSFGRALMNARAVKSHGVLKLARRLGDSHHQSVIATRWIDGEPFATRDEVVPPSRDRCELTGAALAELHAQRSVGVGLLTPDAIARQLRAIPPLVASIAGDFEGLATELCQDLVSRLNQDAPAVTIHGDFYAHQVLMRGSRCAIVDLDELSCGPAAFDIGNFMAQWHCRIECADVSNACCHALVDRMRDAMMSGYRANGGVAVNHDDLDLYTAIGCVKLAARSFRRRESNWRDSVGRILERARVITQRLPRTTTIAVTTRLGERAAAAVSDPLGARHDRLLSTVLVAAADYAAAMPELRRVASSLGERKLHGIRITRYKPNRRCLIEYDFVDGSTLIGKVRARGANEKQFQTFREIHATGFDDNSIDGVSVPEPLGVVPSMSMTLQRKVPGRVATELLELDCGPLLARRIAAAICKLHNCPVRPDRIHSVDDEVSILRERIEQAVRIRRDLHEDFQSLLTRCEFLATALSDRPAACCIHRDFYPDQLMIDGDRIYLLDLDLVSMGDPALDTGNFIAHLRDHGLRLHDDWQRMSSVEAAFESAFIAHDPERTLSAVRAFTSLSMLRLAALSTWLPGREAFTERLIDLTREATERCEVAVNEPDVDEGCRTTASEKSAAGTRE